MSQKGSRLVFASTLVPFFVTRKVWSVLRSTVGLYCSRLFVLQDQYLSSEEHERKVMSYTDTW